MIKSNNLKITLKRISVTVIHLTIITIICLYESYVNVDEPIWAMIFITILPILLILLIHSMVYTLIFCLNIKRNREETIKYKDVIKSCSFKQKIFLQSIYVILLIYILIIGVMCATSLSKTDNVEAEIKNSFKIENLSNYNTNSNNQTSVSSSFVVGSTYASEYMTKYDISGTDITDEGLNMGNGKVHLTVEVLNNCPKWYINTYFNNCLHWIEVGSKQYKYSKDVQTINKNDYTICYSLESDKSHMEIISKRGNKLIHIDIGGVDSSQVFAVDDEQIIKTIDSVLCLA